MGNGWNFKKKRKWGRGETGERETSLKGKEGMREVWKNEKIRRWESIRRKRKKVGGV